MPKQKNTRAHKKDTGAIFIPLLIWGGIAGATALSVWWFGTSAIKGAALDVLTALMTWISYVLLYIAKFLCSIAAEMFDKSLTLLDDSITTDPTFMSGWSVVRDFSNMFIVLGFVVVGIATALRVREWEAKKLLWPLVIVALLINFSGLFCGLIIDASNITSNSLIESAGVKGGPAGSGMGMAYYNMINKLSEDTIKNAPPGNDQETNLKFLGVMISLTFIYLIVGATFLYMAILFLARYGVLAFLYILSPLAFTCKIFPISASQKIWNDWWQGFLKWAFIAVGGSFALWIASNMMQSMLVAQSLEVSSLIVVLIFLVVGFKITTRSSGAMAGAVMGLAAGGAGFAMGKAGKIAGFAADKTGLSRAGNWVKNKTGGALERMGLRQVGTTAGNAASEMEAKQKNVGNLSSEQQAKIASTGAMSHAAVQNKIAAIKNLVKSGDLDKVGDTAAQAQAIKYVESYENSRGIGSTIRKDAEKQNYQLAGFNDKKIQKVMAAQGLTETVARQRVIETQLDESMPGMSHSQLRGIAYPHLTHERVSRLTPEKLSAFRTGSMDQIDQIQGSEVRGRMDAERINLATDKHNGKRIDEGRLSKLNNQIKEIDDLA